MRRVEIIANLSVEADIMDMLREVGTEGYTKIPVVHGVGNSSPKMGDSVWPEENFMLMICTEENIALNIKENIKKLKEKFPDEGIKYYAFEVEHI
jgi:nitrogen regulatory protein PII